MRIRLHANIVKSPFLIRLLLLATGEYTQGRSPFAANTVERPFLVRLIWFGTGESTPARNPIIANIARSRFRDGLIWCPTGKSTPGRNPFPAKFVVRALPHRRICPSIAEGGTVSKMTTLPRTLCLPFYDRFSLCCLEYRVTVLK